MEQKTLRLFILKNLIYTLLILIAFLLQETPAPLALEPLRPVMVISIVTAIAMTEGEFAGGLFGLFGGILCDTAVFHLFGVASIFFLLLGIACGLLIIYLMQPTIKSAFLLSGSFCLIYGLAVHYLNYGMWGYEGALRLLWIRTIPCALSTAVLGMLCYRLVQRICFSFEEAMRR